MQIIDSAAKMQAISQGQGFALIPTMGNLHAGHLSLVQMAQPLADKTVVSIFVNPTQFGPNEDFEKYPRTFEEDCQQLENLGVNYVFAPKVSEIYPADLSTQTFVKVPGISDILCGASRPGHFQGVATIVSKLFHIIQPKLAIFGQKDFQQLQIIRRMVADLSMSVQIHSAPIVREANGLAMSSRNRYLSAEDREKAALIFQSLKSMVEQARENRQYDSLTQSTTEQLNSAGFRTDYIAIRRQEDLQLPSQDDKKLVALAAVYLGNTRLIDNITFEVL